MKKIKFIVCFLGLVMLIPLQVLASGEPYCNDFANADAEIQVGVTYKRVLNSTTDWDDLKIYLGDGFTYKIILTGMNNPTYNEEIKIGCTEGYTIGFDAETLYEHLNLNTLSFKYDSSINASVAYLTVKDSQYYLFSVGLYSEEAAPYNYTIKVEAAIDNGIAMYRLYNPNTGEHFYTSSRPERDNLWFSGWDYENIAWYSPHTGTPVYRLYNPNVGDHHYTMNSYEKDSLVAQGWKYEGVAWYSGGSVPMYRAYNPNAKTGTHHYTKDTNEINNIVAHGWRNEGFSWYALK